MIRPDAIYSGLLECPLTTRIKKLFDGSPDFNDTYSLETFKCSKTDPTNSSFCVQNDVNGISGDVPTAGASTAELQYAGITGDATSCESICANASSSCTGFTWISPSFSQPAWHKMCYLRKSGVMATAITAGIVTGTRGACGGAKQCPTLTASAKECFAAVASLPTITNMSIINNTVTSTDIPPGCSIVVAPDESKATAIFNENIKSSACCGVTETSDVIGLTSAADGAVSVRLNVSGAASTVTLTLSGPSDVWYGVGFNATAMDGAYTIIIEGKNVSERKLGDHTEGSLLSSSVTVLSNVENNGMRTVVLTR